MEVLHVDRFSGKTGLTAEVLAILLYLALLVGVGVWSFKRDQTAHDFIIGSRSLNFWLTALAAHASDMSSWLFMGFPAIIFTQGVSRSWFAVGLAFFMGLNWLFVAPKVRSQTEHYNSLTLSSFFENRFQDHSGKISLFTALLSLIFYTIYISAGMVGLGLLIESLFHIPYHIGITVGVIIIIPYLFIGGYVTLAWLDCFQGIFLLIMLILVPSVAYVKVGGLAAIREVFAERHLSLSMVPDHRFTTYLDLFFSIFGWGIGYFGQPHIITKFMGIAHSKEMKKSMIVGMSWQGLALTFATLVGIIGVPFFSNKGLEDSQLVFVNMVVDLFPPFVMAFILCAILAATISTMDSQILVLASSLTEDFYKRIFHKEANSRERLWVSRMAILLTGLVSYLVAFFKVSSIYSLVCYAWSGLGSSFGPLLIFGLFSKRANKYGAWSGILVGGGISLIWPYVSRFLPLFIPTLVPGFLCSSLAIYCVSLLTQSEGSRA